MDSSSKFHSTNATKPMAELVSSNPGTSISIGSSRVRSKEMEDLSFEISKYPRDLLHTFISATNQSSSSSRIRLEDPMNTVIGDEEEDGGSGGGYVGGGGLNLGLGLSLGGRFGVDKSHNRGLIRSSSIAGTMPLFRDEDTAVAPPPPPTAASGLARTSSLPVKTEDEWRKRKEIQTLRRLEAKRRRADKQRVLKEGSGGGSGGSGGEEKTVENLKFRGRLEREQQTLGITNKLIGSSVGDLFGSSTPPPPPPTDTVVKGRRTTFGSLQGFLMAQAQVQQGSSQGSGESQGASASELESKTLHGSSSCGEARSLASSHSLEERSVLEAAGSTGTKGDSSQKGGGGPEAESSIKQPDATESKKSDVASSGIEDMPCVFTIGDGPNGRKVEGIVYKYGKGEGVRIMCVCHGTFFSPADFVKHAGGRDVEHPLRHIVVSPSAFH